MTARRSTARVFPVAAAAALLMAAGESVSAPARDILAATGVRGGLVVHVGCGDGRLTAALRSAGGASFLVHGIDTDPRNVARARAHFEAQGLSGQVSVDIYDGTRLPFADNLVRLIVSEDMGRVPAEEVMRVLCPEGTAYVKRGGRWTKTVKPRPEEIDEWTHYLHGPDGNAVANDLVAGPPRHMQWRAKPTWSRNHHKLASISSVVTAGGRVFAIVDEATAASMSIPGKWFLTARDAYSGVLLWKRPMKSWAYHGKGFRSGPVQLPRTLVAAAERVYAPLAMSAPVSAVDSGTGEVVRTYEDTTGAEELVLADGTLFVVSGSPFAEQAGVDPAYKGKAKFPNEKALVAVRAETGKILWKWSDRGTGRLMPLTLAVSGGRAFLQVGKGVLCLDGASGREVWRCGEIGPAGGAATASAKEAAAKPGKGGRKKPRRRKKPSGRGTGWSMATLVVAGGAGSEGGRAGKGVALLADGGKLRALSAASGEELWQAPARAGFKSPTDVFVIGGLVWTNPDFSEGRDLRTGEVKKRNAVFKDLRTSGHHHRCYRQKATERYIMEDYRGIEFMDLAGDNHSRNNWIRGTCQYGVMPANGLIYAPSHACGCFMEAKLYGFWAVAAKRLTPFREAEGDRLERGPAYGKLSAGPASGRGDDEWPTLRGDSLRSASTEMELPGKLAQTWQADVGGRLSAPVAAGRLVVVTSIDAHRVIALDAADGRTRWTFTADGRVDSPPTLYKGLALFGCADGRVYCLRATDGEVVWRFRAAPEERRTVALDRVESVWPVHGSVLVHDGVAYAAAGRSSYLDSGIYLFGLDPATGRIVHRGRIEGSHPKLGEGRDRSDAPVKRFSQNATDYKTFGAPDLSDAFSMEGTISDVLVSDGESVYLRHMRFDKGLVRQKRMGRHLFSTSRILDGAENHRSHLVIGTGNFSRTPVAYSWIANSGLTGGGKYGYRLAVPYGLVLSFDDTHVWGVRRTRGYGYTLFSQVNKPFSGGRPAAGDDEAALPDFRKAGESKPPELNWTAAIPVRPRAIVRAGDLLCLGGMAAAADAGDPHATYEGRKGGVIWTVSAADGKKVAELDLASPPVWNGMAAARGRLFLATMDGKVVCMGGGR